MIICKNAKTPYNVNKWILWALSKWEYGGCLLYAYISHEFVFLWCTPLYIECFQCVIDKCYHYWLTSKIFDMVSAGGGRTTVLYAIKFHATDFSCEYVFIWTHIHLKNIWIHEHMFIYLSMTKTHTWMVVHMSVYVNTWTNVHMYKWLYAI